MKESAEGKKLSGLLGENFNLTLSNFSIRSIYLLSSDF